MNNGYTTINLDGDVIGLKFAYPAIRMWAEAMAGKAQFFYQTNDSTDPENPKITVSLEGLAKFIECGYRNNCMIKEVEPLFKYENFFNWVEGSINDEQRSAEILEVMKCYQDSIYFQEINKPNGAAKTEDEKKNLVGMT